MFQPPKPKLSKAEKEKLKAEEDIRKAAEEGIFCLFVLPQVSEF